MRRPHYAWVVCLGGGLSLFTIIGLGINIFSVYQPYIIELNGFTNAQGSLITTIRSLFSLVAMLTVNQLCSRFGLRAIMTGGMLLLSASCVCFGMAEHFLIYCVAAALTGLAYGYGGMIPLSLVIGHWFRDRRGFALGLAAAGSGVSTIFAPSIVTRLIENRGMRTAFLLEAAVILGLAVLVWILVRSSPEDLKLEPYYLEGKTAVDECVPTRRAPRGMTRVLWGTVLVAGFLIGGPGGPGFSHLTVLYTTSGYDSMVVADILAYLGFTLCVGKIICGQVYDVLGGWWANFYIFGIYAVGFSLCCLAPLGGSVLPFLAMTAFGMGVPISAIPFAVWAGDLFGDDGYEGAVRSLTVAYALGSLVFGPAPGVLADWFKSYVPAYALFALILVVSMLIVQYAYYKVCMDSKRQVV